MNFLYHIKIIFVFSACAFVFFALASCSSPLNDNSQSVINDNRLLISKAHHENIFLNDSIKSGTILENPRNDTAALLKQLDEKDQDSQSKEQNTNQPDEQSSQAPSIIPNNIQNTHNNKNIEHKQQEIQDSAIELHPSEIRIGNNIIPYTIDYYSASAPNHGASLWSGNDSTTDGSWGYFIGHHPGDFQPVMSLSLGDTIEICDRNGTSRRYKVIDIFDVPSNEQFYNIEQRITSHGESAILQTCVGDNASYRIVVAN